MSALLQYRPLFSVRVLIDYFLTEEAGLYPNEESMAEVLEAQRNRYNLGQNLRIEPTPGCKLKLRDNRLLFKRNREGFFVGGQVLPDGNEFTPFVPLREPLSLRFAVYLENPLFCNYTNLRLERELAEKDVFLYYFSNRSENVVATQLYLTQPMADFDNTYAYEAGEIYIDRSDPANPTMQEALRDNGPGNLVADQWRQIFTDFNPLFQFVSADDRIVLRPRVFKFDVSSAGLEALSILIRNRFGSVVKTLHHQTSISGVPLEECVVDVNDLPTDYYRLEVFGTDLAMTFFMDDYLFQKRPFALIECFHEPDGSLGDYRWLDQDNNDHLLSPQYAIRWKNRPTSWRYYFETAPTFSSTQVANLDNDPENENHRILISTDPLALTQVGRPIVITVNEEEILLPNPEINMIYPEDGQVYSEINMGGGLGPPS